jgi:HAD superfamily hydrolase (TIGR01509 family)
MKNSYRNLFILFGIAAIAVMLFTFDMDYRELWANIHRAGYWFFAVIGIWLIIYLFNTLTWFLIIRNGERPSPVPFWRIYKLTVSGFALNYATPFGLMGGEPYRIMELSPVLGTARATSSVILFVMTHIFSHICFWLSSIVLYFIMYTPTLPMALFLLLTSVVLSLLVYFFIVGYRNGMVVKTFKMLGHIPLVKHRARRFYTSKKESLQKIDMQIAELHRQRKSTFYATFASEFIARYLTSTEVFFILKILTPEVNFLDCILIMAFTSLFANIFFFSPMQLGFREGGFALAVSGLSLSGAFGVYTSLISSVRELIWIVIGVALMKVGNIKTSHRRQPVKGLLFDYGGTLDTAGRHWVNVIWEACQQAKVPVTETQFHEAYVHTERYLAQHPVIMPEDNFLALMQKKIKLEMAYLKLDEKYIQPVSQFCYDYARRETEKAKSTLQQLKGKYPMAIVSNFYGNMHAVLQDFGLLNFFDDIIDSATVGIRKPSADIWRLGVGALGLRADEVCVVGDSLDKDIRPAKSIGCQTIWLNNAEGTSPASPNETATDDTISSIDELPQKLTGHV